MRQMAIGCALTVQKPFRVTDSIDNTTIAEFWEEQALVNTVKLRYAGMWLFAEVASVVNGCTPEDRSTSAVPFPRIFSFTKSLSTIIYLVYATHTFAELCLNGYNSAI